MANGKRKAMYDVVIDHICMFGQAWQGEFKPQECNPYRKKITPDQLRDENEKNLAEERMFRNMEAAFQGKHNADW